MIGRQAAAVFRECGEAAAGEASALDGFIRSTEESRASIAAEREAAGKALAAVYLPELSGPALAACAQWSGFRGFVARDPLQAIGREAARLTRDIATAEADERWTSREALVGPYGKLTRALGEAQEYLAPWQAECDRFEQQETFLELVRIGYDTPAFEERWWQPSYWKHWAAGDRICAALGLADFGDDVLPAYQKVAEPRDKWLGEVRRLEGEIAGVHAHVQARDAAVHRLQHLPEIYLEEAHTVLARHLLAADATLLAQWADAPAGDFAPPTEEVRRAIHAQLKVLSGLAAKDETLQEMVTRWARPQRDQLQAAAAKFQMKAQKYSQGRKSGQMVSSVPVDYVSKLQRQRERREKAHGVVHRVVGFNEYDRFSLSNDPALWWLLFSDNRPPGVYTPSLRDWYARHPEARFEEDADWREERDAPVTSGLGHLSSYGDVS